MIYGFNAGEVFKIAVQIEENGRLFYEKALTRADHPQVRDIFDDLGREELKHKARFTELLNALPEKTTGTTVWDPQGEMDQYLKMMADMHVFRTADGVEARIAGLTGPKDALELAIQFEKDSIVFFAEMQTMTESADAQKEIGQLVREEQAHLKRLALQLRKLNQGA
jgi:rubrerythrin